MLVCFYFNYIFKNFVEPPSPHALKRNSIDVNMSLTDSLLSESTLSLRWEGCVEHVRSLGGYSITRLLSFIFINLKNTDGRYRSVRSTSPVETRKNETLKKKKIESRRAISKYTNLIGFCYNIKKDLKQIRSRCPCTKNQIFHQISSSFSTVLIGNQYPTFLHFYCHCNIHLTFSDTTC